uniref:AB hydrolase-1 domain-containing protein n=1 Tax=Plectus sambesii TaxID=2011161 RepID=A0A914XUZ3_9BILA
MAREEAHCRVDDVSLNYVKAGRGDHYVLCLPGAIGSWQTDFKIVLDKFDHDDFTIVCWDPPGFGKSRPPNRDFSPGYNARDASKAFKLMQALNLLPFSIFGWSDGGITALQIGFQQRNTDNVNKIVIWGSTSYVTEEMVMVYRGVMDTSKWSEHSRRPYVEMYGEEYFQWAWANHLQARIDLFERHNGNKCREIVPFVPQPVLILHGKNDIYATQEHPDFFLRTLPNSKLLIKDGAAHNLHIQHFNWFKQHVSDFLLNH